MDLIEEGARRRAKDFYYNSPSVKAVKLSNSDTKEIIKCHECNNTHFKFYKKTGGLVISYYRNKVMKDNPFKHLFVCKCGIRLILTEGTFEYAKMKYGCSAGKCPYGQTKMTKDCLKCKYIYEK